MTVYTSPSVLAAAATQRRRLRVHHADVTSGLCARCGRPAPCDDARAGVDFLVERSLPLVDEPGPAGRRSRWPARRRQTLVGSIRGGVAGSRCRTAPAGDLPPA